MAEADTIEGADPFAAELAALIAADAALAPVAEMAGPLPARPLSADFDGLAKVVISQQLSVAAANAIHERCLARIEAFSPRAIL
ncbi:MAG: DNA-3-methyladenine glycosylase 2 family protein, partial [Dichotomicrobium sp.]